MKALRLLVLLFPAVLPLAAQPLPPDAGRQLATLSQDVAMLRSQVGQLQLALEASQREQAELRRRLESASGGVASLTEVNRQLAVLRDELREADARNRREIVAELGAQIESLATQTDAAVKALAKSIEAAPPPIATSFSDDYPKTGVTYTVQRGDTLSTIARRHNASVRDIQNANQISDPSKLRQGMTLFIPQRRSP